MSKATDRAYDRVRTAILDGTLAPGAQLTETDIAELCGVSRTPVREAMGRLEAEMFIERTDSQRSFVSNWSDDDIEDLFTLRTMLESYAAGRAVRNVTAATLTDLQATSIAIARAIRSDPPDIDAFLRENAIFHRLIIEAAASPRLGTMMARLVLVPVVHQTAHQYSQAQLERSLADHDEIIAAFEARDAHWAQAVMTSHIRRAFHAHRGDGGDTIAALATSGAGH